MSAESSHFAVSFATGTRYNIDQIRRRQQAFMPDGEHAWVVHTVYAIEDPEQEMNSMELGADNFIGVSANIYCLLCNRSYHARIRHYKCPQAVPRDGR